MGVFRMPSLGADMEAGTLVEWLVKPGDTVKRGDVIAVVETQKGAIEIECFEEGVVQSLRAKLHEELPVGAPLAVILGPEEAAPGAKIEVPSAELPERAPVPQPQPAPLSAPNLKEPAPVTAKHPESRGSEIAATPAARLRARELGVDLASLSGSGPDGAILLADVEAGPSPVLAEGPERKAAAFDDMRKAIAAAMTRAKQTIPHFYLSETIDVQPAQDWLAARNSDAQPADRILMGALFVRATVLAAQKVGSVNGQYVDGAFRASGQVNAGVAIALRGGGLVAPALMDAGAMDLRQTMAAMRDLVTRARAGRLRSSEMTEGTITISSLGETGAEAMTGVIFPPQVALVGLGAPHLRPWVVDGSVIPRWVVTLTLSADHRVSDGRQAARFIAEFETLIAKPEAL